MANLTLRVSGIKLETEAGKGAVELALGPMTEADARKLTAAAAAGSITVVVT